jgi:homocysteine S-methyltransferase
MDPDAWCGPAALENANVLEVIHRDYIAAGADIITANTYASSRLMLGPAGLGNRLEDIVRTAVEAAHRAREASGRNDVLIAGSLSDMSPIIGGTGRPDLTRAPSPGEMAEAFEELAQLLRDTDCDLVLLEMMYRPERLGPLLEAATHSGLPVWAGFTARDGEDARVLSYAPEREIPFTDLVQVLKQFDVAAAGVMHTPSHIIGDAVAIVRDAFTGPLLAYPDSGYFKMPHWQFENVISPGNLFQFANGWVESGVQIIGGCCGLSPEHIAALAPLKDAHLA